ncbi:MAG: hypothetical protein MUE41_16225 [Gemmatimonadaceae bacterium]|nr:hypothetical protein [Gemmatimonadaceae bacterium]
MHPLLVPVYRSAAALATAAARVVAPGDGKVQRAFAARRDAVHHLVDWARVHRDRRRALLWMHAPSVGEGLQARPVLERLRRTRPDFDTVGAADTVLAAVSPTALVFAKLDVWPQLVERAAAQGVRTGLISATLPTGSARSGWVARALLRDAYAALDLVGAIDADDAARLLALGVRADRMSVTGDTRYDQVATRAAQADRRSTLLASVETSRPTVIAGSTWPSDEMVLFAAWQSLRTAVPTARLIIAAHEPTEAHLAPIEQWARGAGLSCARLEAVLRRATSPDVDVLVVDRVGVLGDLYALADVAFVGGGFHAAGLHSVLEPAAFGVPVLFGPGGDRVRDARALSVAGGGRLVHDAESLASVLGHWLTVASARAAAGHAARAVVEEGVGAAERSTALVEQLLR